MTNMLNVYEAKSHLSAILERVQNGEDFVIAKAGRPVARLVRWRQDAPRTPGLWAGKVVIKSDFDDFTTEDETDWYGT